MLMKRRRFLRLLIGGSIAPDYVLSSTHDVTAIAVERDTLRLANQQDAQYKRSVIHSHSIKTGFNNIDHLIHGLGDGKLIVIASRPSVGKSMFLQNIVQNIASTYRITIAYFTNVKQLALEKRMISYMNINNLKTLHENKIFINYSRCLTLDELSTYLSDMALQKDIQVLAIDSLENIYLGQSPHSTREEIIYGHLKHLAKILNIPVLITTGLNENLETRNNKRPVLTDLNNYRVIEKYADSIIYIYRDEIYNEETCCKGEVEILIENKDDRPNGLTRLYFSGKEASYRDYKPLTGTSI